MEQNLGIMLPDGRELDSDARPAFREDWVLSSKLQLLVNKLLARKANKEEGESKKSVIYTQWRCFMDWIVTALDCHGIKNCELHGGMTSEQRTWQLKKFRDTPDVEAFIVSIEAGGVGLNMTCADEVYLMDAHWNPQIVQQAIDRLHRIGQTKPVKAYHVVAGDSVEQHLFNVQKKKASLARKVITLSVPKNRLQDCVRAFDTMEGQVEDVGDVDKCYKAGF
ncbi:P-loop containing nucleoside triphosphate hydrolase protein [Melampsora americana]|nr:P-loop containing nucleoside triphosphate hydrolase protein [Melampsora americana]KAH9824228.1 P-loop containing nucleoside triphosphate hydrolase protein [Melampsora americana]